MPPTLPSDTVSRATLGSGTELRITTGSGMRYADGCGTSAPESAVIGAEGM
jgi:hypothetical protein